MSKGDEWSPDGQPGSEAFEQGDEALDEGTRVNPRLLEEIEADPSLDPALQLDERELEEIGAVLDDPEDLATLDGGIDDPDGIERPAGSPRAQSDHDSGWQLDEPLTGPEDAGEVLEA
jgi:hypothetical protein